MAQRVSQAPAQVVHAPTSELARVSQASAQVVHNPTSQLARVTQVVLLVVTAKGGAAFVGEPGGSVW